jgi:Trk K+ transport system NAD-binding subunit
MKPRILVCGLGQTGYTIFSLLKQQGAAVVGVSDRRFAHQPDDIVIGDLRSADTLVTAGIKTAQTLLITSSDDSLNLAILTQARILNPRIRIINRLFNHSLGERLDQTLADHFSLSVSSLAAPLLAFAAQGNHAIGQLQLFGRTWPIQEEWIDSHHRWNGRPLSELWADQSRMLIYYLPVQSEMDLVSAVMQGQRLQTGDRIIVANRPRVEKRGRSLKQRWLSFITGLRHFRQQIRSGLGITLVLLLLIWLATLTYTSVSLSTSMVDALYFAVGMITGAGGNEEVAEEAPVIIKIFTVIIMLVGTAVIGICYAILNDLVLGTHFQQVVNAVHLPQRRHYIVCGLGGLGFQIVQQLRMSGHEVVVIESDPNCRFLGAVRAMKIPVILGDANVATILESAHVNQAEALLAMTSDDMTNLEIALTTKALAPKLRIVVRNQDPDFAPQVQQVFEFDMVLSPTKLAAPSFAAAALGGRVLGNGVTANSLWVALGTMITPNHPFFGHRVKDVAMLADLVPLYIEASGRTLHGWDLLEFELDTGDVLYLTMPASRLELLWRHASSSLMAS